MIKYDKIRIASLMLMVIGIDWFFGILSHPSGSKYDCGSNGGCRYMGILFFLVGIVIFIYRYKMGRKQ